MTTETLQKANDLNDSINQLMYATEQMTCKDDKRLAIVKMGILETELKNL